MLPIRKKKGIADLKADEQAEFQRHPKSHLLASNLKDIRREIALQLNKYASTF
jgi:hypothetical protein